MISIVTKLFEKFAVNSDFAYKVCKLYYKNIVNEEIDLASISPGDRVLLIGGGSIPCTAIEFAKRTQADIEVIDIDFKAVENAKNLVDKKGFNSRINIRLADGKKIDPKNYDVIHIAMQVKPKESVLRHILDKSDSGLKVIVREPRSYLKSFYSNISKSFLKNYSLELREHAFRSLTSMDRVKLLIKRG